MVATGDADARCPTCPDWTAADLLWHLTNVHHFWATILSRRLTSAADLPEVEATKPARPQTVAELLTLRERATAMLLAELGARDDAEPCWSWWPPDQTVGFTRRMQTYEATMHRVDAELAAAMDVTPLAADVAAGAVDHAVDVMWGWMDDGAAYRPGGIVEFVADDTDARWLVEAGSWTAPGSADRWPRAVRATVGEPTAVVSGPVRDLALWSWTRGGTVQTSGDLAVLSALDAVLTQGMP